MSYKDDFNRKADNRDIDFEKNSTELEPTLQREVKALENQRDKPQLTQEYTIGGSTETTVKKDLAEEKESRIKEIQKQLKSIRECRDWHSRKREQELER